MRIAVIGVALAAQLLLRIAAPWGVALGAGLFCALFWGFPLWWLWRPAARVATGLSAATRDSIARGRAICAASALAVGVVSAVALASATIYGARLERSIAWPLALAIPFAGWGVVALLVRTLPHPMRSLGLTGAAWPINGLIGAVVGAALGGHLLIVIHDLPDFAGASRSASAVAWFISVQLGLRVLGEELFFRGLGFHLLRRLGAGDRGLTAWLVLLNLVAYLWLLGQGREPLAGLLVVYAGVMAFVCTRLRLSRGSLLPGLACQAVFVFFVAAVI
jgi:hypothetical protein